eukprot:scaffold68717_cov69-Phaeocystis_antarctica.AAC.3
MEEADTLLEAVLELEAGRPRKTASASGCPRTLGISTARKGITRKAPCRGTHSAVKMCAATALVRGMGDPGPAGLKTTPSRSASARRPKSSAPLSRAAMSSAPTASRAATNCCKLSSAVNAAARRRWCTSGASASMAPCCTTQ